MRESIRIPTNKIPLGYIKMALISVTIYTAFCYVSRHRMQLPFYFQLFASCTKILRPIHSLL